MLKLSLQYYLFQVLLIFYVSIIKFILQFYYNHVDTTFAKLDFRLEETQSFPT